MYNVVAVVFAEAEEGVMWWTTIWYSASERGTVRGRSASERGNKHGCRMQEDGSR